MQPDSPPIGHCARVIDEAREVICNAPGTEEVLVRNRFGLFAVALCAECKSEHFAYYARNPSRSRRSRNSRERRASQSRGRNQHDIPDAHEEELRRMPLKLAAS